MRRRIISIIAILIVSYIYGQDDRHYRRESILGIDMTTLITETDIGLSVGHSFHEHWSVQGSVIIRTDLIVSRYDDNETEHYKELGVYEDKKKNSNAFYGDISIQYWPSRNFRGFYLGLGCKDSPVRNMDVLIETGYSFRLSEKLSACLTYRTGIIESIYSSRLDIKGFRLSLNIIL